MKDKYNLTIEENLFLAKKLLVSNIYNSSKMEGLNVTYPDTQTILDGVNISNVKLDDINCILNLRDAWKYVLNNINDEMNLTYISKINELVSRNESLEWGVLRTGKVGIAGTDYKPSIPEQQTVISDINNIMEEEVNTVKAIKYMLYGMRNQLFWDGNKRTSMIAANVIMIKNGCGIITIKEENLKEFNELLSEFYKTSIDTKIIDFIYNNCIYGIDFK